MFLSAWEEEEQILKKRILWFSQNTGKPNNIPWFATVWVSCPEGVSFLASEFSWESAMETSCFLEIMGCFIPFPLYQLFFFRSSIFLINWKPQQFFENAAPLLWWLQWYLFWVACMQTGFWTTSSPNLASSVTVKLVILGLITYIASYLAMSWVLANIVTDAPKWFRSQSHERIRKCVVDLIHKCREMQTNYRTSSPSTN